MKIGLDLRFLSSGDYYSDFIYSLVKNLIKTEKENQYILFLNISYSQFDFGENTKNITVNTGNILEEQYRFKKILNKNKLDKVIFFNYNKPIKYKCNYIMFIANLEEFHFSPQKNIFKKYFDNFLLSENAKNANKIICFNENIKIEINDKLNIFEDNIEIITPFFKENSEEIDNFNLDIKTKYNIKEKYLIYHFGAGESKNIDRLIDLFEGFNEKDIKISLVVLDNSTVQDINLRKKIIEKNLNNKIYFIGEVSKAEKKLFFKNSIAVIYPLLYSIFPFSLSDSINYKTPIIISNLKSIKSIFNTKVTYINKTDIREIYSVIVDQIAKNKKEVNYDDIKNNYNIEKTTAELINIIK